MNRFYSMLLAVVAMMATAFGTQAQDFTPPVVTLALQGTYSGNGYTGAVSNETYIYAIGGGEVTLTIAETPLPENVTITSFDISIPGIDFFTHRTGSNIFGSYSYDTEAPASFNNVSATVTINYNFGSEARSMEVESANRLALYPIPATPTSTLPTTTWQLDESGNNNYFYFTASADESAGAPNSWNYEWLFDGSPITDNPNWSGYSTSASELAGYYTVNVNGTGKNIENHTLAVRCYDLSPLGTLWYEYTLSSDLAFYKSPNRPESLVRQTSPTDNSKLVLTAARLNLTDEQLADYTFEFIDQLNDARLYTSTGKRAITIDTPNQGGDFIVRTRWQYDDGFYARSANSPSKSVDDQPAFYFRAVVEPGKWENNSYIKQVAVETNNTTIAMGGANIYLDLSQSNPNFSARNMHYTFNSETDEYVPGANAQNTEFRYTVPSDFVGYMKTSFNADIEYLIEDFVDSEGQHQSIYYPFSHYIYPSYVQLYVYPEPVFPTVEGGFQELRFRDIDNPNTTLSCSDPVGANENGWDLHWEYEGTTSSGNYCIVRSHELSASSKETATRAYRLGFSNTVAGVVWIEGKLDVAQVTYYNTPTAPWVLERKGNGNSNIYIARYSSSYYDDNALNFYGYQFEFGDDYPYQTAYPLTDVGRRWYQYPSAPSAPWVRAAWVYDDGHVCYSNYVDLNGSRGGTDASIDAPQVDSAEAPAEYYTLQGVRVDAAALAPGLYIVRQGRNVSKVMINN